MRTALFLLLILFAGSVLASINARQSELSDLRDRIEQLKNELERAAGDRAEAADALKDSERNISEVNRALRNLRDQERRLNQELDRLAQSTREHEMRLWEQERQLAELARQRYFQRGSDAASLLLGGHDPARIQRDLEYFAYIGRARSELIAAHRQTLDQLARLRLQTEQKRAKLDGIKSERLSQRQALEKEKQTRQALLGQLSEQIRQQRREIDTLMRDEQRLTRLIERLRRAMPPPTRTPSRPPRPERQVDQVADASLASLDFPKLRGKLALPVAGEIIAQFGQKRDGGGPSWKGVFIRAGNGQNVRAVGTGQVVFADWLRGFGNLIIVDHGDGYLSLYSNNESLYKQPGDNVRAGDVIATVGNTGGQESTGLYFELRHQGKPFDPMTWVASR